MNRQQKFKGEYPPEWTKEFRSKIRGEFGNCCERCGHPHDPDNGYALTVHHLDNDKSNLARWNLAVLCQRCHLQVQGRMDIFQTYMFTLSDWFRPHYLGFLEAHHLNQTVEEFVSVERSLFLKNEDASVQVQPKSI